jgi:hypothetical protein
MNPTRLHVSIIFAGVMLVAAPVRAQEAPSGITGLVRDTSGAVLPGVTVEAASPALIEKVRTAITDSEGRYNIVDLRPGTYSIGFGLSGFRSLRREGIVLQAGFTATVNAELQLGAIEETITVSGASPVVDTQNSRQQRVVSSNVLESLPTSTKSLGTLVALVPGMTGPADVGGSSGTYSSANVKGSFHGKVGVGNKMMYDSMRVNNMASTSAMGYIINAAVVEEMTVETGGASAESAAAGIVMNNIPKEGGNAFSVAFSGLFTKDTWQSDNLTDELRSRGLNTVNKVLNLYDAAATSGGPIRKDRLWFFTAHRKWGNRNQLANLFFNKTQGTPFYTPDLARAADRDESYRAHALRLTWQAAQKHKMSFFVDLQDNIVNSGTSANAVETISGWHFWPQGLFQMTWSSPVTNRLLLEAGASLMLSHWPNFRQPGVTEDHISILEQSTNFRYNAYASLGSDVSYGGPKDSDRYNQRFITSYVTGSHVFKTGIYIEEGIHNTGNAINGDIAYQFLSGVPVAIDQFATPYLQRERMKADIGLFVQDKWTLKRLTLNGGLRFDYFNAHVADQHVPETRWLPARDFQPVHGVPLWKDLNPRFGASYDLFGNGRTALKMTLGRYVDMVGINIAIANNQLVTSVNQVQRPWNDANGNFVPDCDLRSPVANGECGAFGNQNFGRLNPNATRYADDVLHGFGVRPYMWDLSTEIQHELRSGLSLTAGYYRNWAGNFSVTDNLAVTPADYSPYCVTAPPNAELPGGGGFEVCGLYDINPNRFGQVNNLVTQASHYGTQKRISDFVTTSLSARLPSGTRLEAGLDTGRIVNDNCFVIDSPQQLLNCHVVTPWSANLQGKVSGTVPLPRDFAASGIFQNVAGPHIIASYPAPTAAIAPSLGRNLAGGVRSAVVPLMMPQTRFEGRKSQLDLRLTKNMNIGRKGRLRVNLDVYNVLNASSILTINTTYGSQWLRPLSVLDGRLIEVGGQLTF